MDKKYLSKLTIGGNQYDLKDAEARQDIADIQSSITGAMHYLGASSTAIADGDKTGPWTIDGVVFIASGTPAEGQVLLKAGDVATYDNGTKELEFVWSGAAGAWREYGSTGSLKALAFKDSATGSITCAGTNADSAVSFSGTTTETVLKAIDDAAVLPSFTEGTFSAGTLPSYTEGAFSAGTLPSYTEGTFSAGTLPSFTEGSFTPASLAEGFVTAGSAASYSHSGFSGGSLGAATTGSFATEGITATVDESNELLTISDASTSSAVTAQGTFTAAVYGTDTFNGGTPTAIDVTKFNGGSKAADSFSAGTLPSKAADVFDAGTLPSKTADTWSAGTLPSKAADTFDAGSAATFTTETVVTDLGTATAAAQVFTGSTVSVTVS